MKNEKEAFVRTGTNEIWKKGARNASEEIGRRERPICETSLGEERSEIQFKLP